jgi:RimJ/RimL family protein N-acetyltransferase
VAEILSYTVRPAALADSRFLFNLSMDPSVRETSTRSDVFTFEEHERWYHQKLGSPLNRIWIMEVEDNPVAQVRYGKVEEPTAYEAEIAISVSPLSRGKGYASTLLRETEPLAAQFLDVTRLVALVVVGNEFSCRLFMKSGYTPMGYEIRMGKDHHRLEKSVIEDL